VDLKVDFPEVVRRVEEFNAEFPAVAGLMTAPDEDGFALFQTDGVHDLELLADGEGVWSDGHAASGANVHGLAVDGTGFVGFGPVKAHGDTGVDAHSGAHELQGFHGFDGHRCSVLRLTCSR
jgi:hypothetical protein